MRITKMISMFFMLICANFLMAQDDDLLKSLDSASVGDKTMTSATAFKALQVVNMQSTKTPAKQEFYLIVAHRFGNLDNEGENFFDNFLGLDSALTKIGGIYSITDWLSVEASRQTPKLYELGTKYRLISQSENFPVTIVGRNTVNINTNLKKTTYPNVEFNDKLSYTNQLLLSRKFSDKISLELAGVWVHKNLINETVERKDLAVAALGGRYKLSNRVSVNAEYGYRINTLNNVYDNPASLGLDIDTGGHVFQIVVSNMQSMSDVAYYSGSKSGVFLGFNMYRVF